MSSFQSNPKQKSNYPGMLNKFDKNRRREWLKAKLGQQNRSFSGLNSQRLQMFSGKRGK